ncbi:unnamed protein product [Absidia cylindrospora]
MIWLTHSRRSYCELCDHRYSFSPVYRMDMPDTIPTRLYVWQLGKKLLNVIYIALRCCLVACLWLFVLPYFTLTVWRFYFWTGELFGEQLLRLQNYSAAVNQQLYVVPNGNNVLTTTTFDSADTTDTLKAAMANNSTFSQSITQQVTNATSTIQYTVLGQTLQVSNLKIFLTDCIEGQVITFITVVVFISIFHLREWIVQNIPDELLEDFDDDPTVNAADQQDDGPEQHEQQPLEPLIEQDEENENLPNHIQVAHIQEDNYATNTDDSESHYPTERMEYEIRQWNRRAASETRYTTRQQQHLDDDDDLMMSNAYRQHRATSAEPIMNPYSSGLHERKIKIDPSTDLPTSSNWHPPQEHDDNDDDQTHTLEDHLFHPHPQMEADEPVLQPIRQATPPLLQDPLMNDDDDNIGDDILDILDVIGMQGSLWTLVQNIAMIGMVICSSLVITIWLPYLIGVTFVMADIFEVVRIPLLLARMLTDPIIDWLIVLFMDITWPTPTANLTNLVSTTHTLIQDLLASIFTNLTRLLPLSAAMIESNTSDINPSIQNMSDSISLLSLETILDTFLHWWVHQAEPVVMGVVAWYQHLAIGTSMMDRAICIVIGYILALAMSTCYVTQSLAVMMFGDRAQETLRQQYLILKVGIFLVFELFVFPCFCGILLDVSTLSLLDFSSSIWRRLDHIHSNMMTSMFVYWFLGSGFMLMFAWLITRCRDILRPGVFWFISDHNDPQFHPIKEIIQRPVWNHLEKLAISAAMYTTIIVIGIGGVVQPIDYLGRNYLPREWNLARPITVIPFDLIVVQIVVPVILYYFRPMRTIKKVYVGWMRFLCRQLRLTCFMFGIRTMDEEGAMRYDTWTGWLRGTVLQQQDRTGDGTLIWDGQLVRAPKRDGLKSIPGRRMLVPVHRTTFLPLDEREQRLSHPASRTAGGDEVNTMIVYTPPRFKERLAFLVTMLLISGSLLICSMAIVPLALGRYIFKEGWEDEEPIHDLNAYLAGGALVLVVGTMVGFSADVISDVVSQSNTSDRLHSLSRHIAYISRWAYNLIFFIVSFNVILPLLIGLVVEMHFIFPFQDLGDKLPVLDAESIWICGFALISGIHGVLLMLPANILQANLIRFLCRSSKMELRTWISNFCALQYWPHHV